MKNNTMQKPQQIREIYLVRALAIIGVIMVHSTSGIVAGFNTESSLYGVYNFLNIFFKFGTPTFIFLSSFVLFFNYYHKPLTKERIAGFYKKRLLFIVIPYLIFSILYFALTASVQGYTSTGEMMNAFLVKFMTGKAYTHLYFVFISIQLYILFPFILMFLKKFPKVTKHTIWIGFVLQWAFVLMNHYYWQYSLKGSISFSYMSYYFLGAFMGIHYKQILDYLIVTKEKLFSKNALVWLPLWAIWIAASAGHVGVWYVTRANGAIIDSKIYELLWNVHTFTSALVLMQIAYWLYRNLHEKVLNVMIHLGVVSFGVYLIHPILLLIARKVLVTSDPILYHVAVASFFLFALIGSWIIVGFIMKYKKSWVLFGPKPKDPYVPSTKESTARAS
ncbi:acyltransferase [Fictibacillus phosphorivorans]|uniref:acyltransferase n=1 Tax=Fictibacillus phosphorivorans TaxID=1221500 RepID=UPI002041AE20|nr:acyltransferase [Fictibacillus phosphorivorans]MCM3718480.1 acyltransferase [Fictibacillus phosphorivorans]MCM3776164.1 acyltransferase [Fictibacillus phosphorivorans]